MRPAWVLCLLLASVLSLPAEDWTTADGKVYKNVTVVGQEDDGVRITYEGGVGKIPYYELPVETQRRFGQDIDSLAAKKKAVDKAIDDAVRSAIAADEMKLEAEAPPAPRPASPPPSPQPVVAPGTDAANATVPGATMPGVTAASNAAPANPVSPVSHPADIAPAAETVSRTPMPDGIKGSTGKPLELSVANYSFNSNQNVCYLDSPAVDFIPDVAPKTPLPPGQGSSLRLRVVTEGPQPQTPDKIEATFLSVGATGEVGANPVTFTTDGTQVAIEDSARKDSGTLPGGGQTVQYATFYLTASQARTVCSAKELSIVVGGQSYKPRAEGMAVLQHYLDDVNSLPPAPSSFARGFYKLLARIPPFFSIISTICEWVVIGSFTILVAASIAAFILGVTRFIKM